MLRSFVILFLSFLSIASYSTAQVSEKNKDFKCNDIIVYESFDLLKSTRSYGNYDPEEEWSEYLTSGKIIRKRVDLDGGRQYTILLVTEKSVDASAIEIRDDMGLQLEYVFKINELDREQINLFYTPVNDGTYQIYFRVINSRQPASCTYMAILEGDLDPEYGTFGED
jgi:hypothetical protein